MDERPAYVASRWEYVTIPLTALLLLLSLSMTFGTCARSADETEALDRELDALAPPPR